MQIIHWLFNEQIPATNQHRWLQTPPMASIKVIKHDYVRQMVTLEAGKRVTTSGPISSKRKDDKDIIREMKGQGVHGNLRLENVGLDIQGAKKAGAKKNQKFGSRTKCDTCMLLNRNTGLTQGCVPVDGAATFVCRNCAELYGRPACSFSHGMPAQFVPGQNSLGNSFKQLDDQKDTVNVIRREALIGLRGWTGSADGLVTTDPVIFQVDTGLEVEEVDEAQFKDAEKAALEPETDWLGP